MFHGVKVPFQCDGIVQFGVEEGFGGELTCYLDPFGAGEGCYFDVGDVGVLGVGCELLVVGGDAELCGADEDGDFFILGG